MPDDDRVEPASPSFPSARLRVQRKKRLEYLQDLLRTLDITIYAHFSILFYLDSSFALFVLRTLTHLTILTPKPANIRAVPPPPSLTTLIIATIISIAFHSLNAAPSAGEATHGYIHGSLLIDFVGVHGPVSKIRLILTDLLVLMMQIVMMGVTCEKTLIKDKLAGEGESSGGDVLGTQDMDAEERGVHREDAETVVDGLDGIELQPLIGEPGARDLDEEEGRPPPLELLAGRDVMLEGPLDTFYTGSVVVAEVDLWDTVRKRFWMQSTAGGDVRESLNEAMRRSGFSVRWRRGNVVGPG